MNRSKLRYPSDVDRRGMGAGGTAHPARLSLAESKRTVIMREVVNGLMYVLSTGCQMARNPERPAPEKHGLRLF